MKIDKIINRKNKIDGLNLMSMIDDETIKAAFFDPQYRGILDKLSYGNEGKSRGTERSALPQMSDAIIISFIKEINRVLVPKGHLFLWVDKFNLCTGIIPWLKDTKLNLVDMIVWDKMKIGMGYRTRRQCEYLMVIQKDPVRAKGCWNDHSIPDIWQEKKGKEHTHSKPLNLQKRLILATTNESDLILDPASGGYSVFKACEETGRNFIGGDLVFGEEITEDLLTK
jgi:site-specific DNA-methyltransferase (adenine-specific)